LFLSIKFDQYPNWRWYSAIRAAVSAIFLSIGFIELQLAKSTQVAVID
jgi:hypothetical protein